MKVTARDIAVLALRDRAGNVTARLETLLGQSPLPAPDRALARELALGTARRRKTLEVVLRSFLQQPGRRLPGALNEILLVALYQILFLDRVPDFAAVNEAVEQAARHHHKRQSGLVNGVLRTVTRNVSEAVDGPVERSPEVIPISPGRFRTSQRGVFPDPVEDAATYLSAAHSLPTALAKRWVDRHGLDKAVKLGFHANARPPLVLRVNTLKANVESVLASLAGEGVGARRHANAASVVLDEYVNVEELGAFRDGLVQPQDATATAVGLRTAPRPGQAVLDFCAAPGTKTTHLAELMEDRGSIVAADVNDAKLAKVRVNCERLGITIVSTLLADQAGSLEPQSFDVVLADVPCTGTGVLARRAEARWRFDEQRLGAIVQDQRWIAKAAAYFAGPGGTFVYSTCSIEPEECRQVAQWLAREQSDLTLVDEKLTLPGGADEPAQWHDGGYCAVFRSR